jgi:hypothetical protein
MAKYNIYIAKYNVYGARFKAIYHVKGHISYIGPYTIYKAINHIYHIQGHIPYTRPYTIHKAIYHIQGHSHGVCHKELILIPPYFLFPTLTILPTLIT